MTTVHGTCGTRHVRYAAGACHSARAGATRCVGPLSEQPCAQVTYGRLDRVRTARLRHAVSMGRDHRSFGMIRQSNDSMRLLLPAQTSSSRMAMAAPPLSSAMRGAGTRTLIAKHRLLAPSMATLMLGLARRVGSLV